MLHVKPTFYNINISRPTWNTGAWGLVQLTLGLYIFALTKQNLF